MVWAATYLIGGKWCNTRWRAGQAPLPDRICCLIVEQKGMEMNISGRHRSALLVSKSF